MTVYIHTPHATHTHTILSLRRSNLFGYLLVASHFGGRSWLLPPLALITQPAYFPLIFGLRWVILEPLVASKSRTNTGHSWATLPLKFNLKWFWSVVFLVFALFGGQGYISIIAAPAAKQIQGKPSKFDQLDLYTRFLFNQIKDTVDLTTPRPGPDTVYWPTSQKSLSSMEVFFFVVIFFS